MEDIRGLRLQLQKLVKVLDLQLLNWSNLFNLIFIRFLQSRRINQVSLLNEIQRTNPNQKQSHLITQKSEIKNLVKQRRDLIQHQSTSNKKVCTRISQFKSSSRFKQWFDSTLLKSNSRIKRVHSQSSRIWHP